MKPQELDALTYVPSLRSRLAELRAYEKLRLATKAQLHPIISLGKLGKLVDANRVLERIAETVPTEFFLDLNTHTGQSVSDIARLRDSANNYEAWRDFAGSVQRAIPVAILREDETERPFIRQVLSLEAKHGVVAIRSRRPAQELASLQAVLSAVDDVNNVLIILDFGYVRGALASKEIEALRVISALRTVDASARLVLMASSFPKAISAYGERRGSLEIIEREFHERLGGIDVAIYGDHGSIYPEPFEPSISRYVPRIDYCSDHAWAYERRKVDEGGYVECAKGIVASPDWEPAFAEASWGAKMVRDTAASQAVPAGFGSPSGWISARVNMHLERQSTLSSMVQMVDGEDNGDGEEAA